MEITIKGGLVGARVQNIRTEQASGSDTQKNMQSSLPVKTTKPNRRGRPKGARTSTLAEVRKQASLEKNQIKQELGEKICTLETELEQWQDKYDKDIARLNDELEILRRRESSYQQALGERLTDVAEHLQATLLHWGAAELEEAQIDKRGRGRPRKTLKLI